MPYLTTAVNYVRKIFLKSAPVALGSEAVDDGVHDGADDLQDGADGVDDVVHLVGDVLETVGGA